MLKGLKSLANSLENLFVAPPTQTSKLGITDPFWETSTLASGLALYTGGLPIQKK